MATRRSRIKAVANLPARRNRPSTISDDVKAEVDSTEVSLECLIKSANSNLLSNSHDITEETSLRNSDQGIDGDSSTEPSVINTDRKSVIVSVEKDRKSVIVNRNSRLIASCPSTQPRHDEPLCKNDLANTSNEALFKKGVITEGKSVKKSIPQSVEKHVSKPEDNTKNCSQSKENISTINQEEPANAIHSHTSLKSNPPLKESSIPQSDENPSSSSEFGSEGVTSSIGLPSASEGTSEIYSSPNIRGSFRGRRSKPIVNLTAASRKRPAPEIALSSPSAPKLRPPDTGNHNVNEGDLDCETIVSSNLGENIEENNVKETISRAQSPPMLMSPPPVPVSSSGTQQSPTTSNIKSKDVPNVTESPSSSGNISSSTAKDSSSGTKRKQSTSALKAAAARKTFKSRFSADRPPPRSALTMFDLIFYNPSKNPMKSSDPPLLDKSRSRQTSISSVSSIHEGRLNEEAVDDLDEDKSSDEQDKDEQEETAMPVPRVKVGPDGSLILDEQSLVIETTGSKKIREELERSEVVIDTGSSYGHYKRTKRSKDWSDNETKKFYRALNVVGTDFSLMQPLFRNRTRRELKLKFKKEERLNASLVNKALNEHLDFDVTELEKECALEEEEEKQQDKDSSPSPPKPPRSKKKPRGAKSRLGAEIGIDVEEESHCSKGPRVRKEVPKKKVISNPADQDYELLSKGLGSDSAMEQETPRTRPLRTQKKKYVVLDSDETDVSEAEKSGDASAQCNRAVGNPLNKFNQKYPKDLPQVQTPARGEPSTFNSVNQKHTAPFQSTAIGSSPMGKQVKNPLFDQTATTGEPSIMNIVSQRRISVSQDSPSGSSPTGKQGTSPYTVQVLNPGPSSSSSVCSPSAARPAVVGTPIRKTVYRIVQNTNTPIPQQYHITHTTPSTPPGAAASGITGFSTPVNRFLPSPNLPKMEPGSLIVLKTPIPENPERHILQVYMVTNKPPSVNNSHAPIVPSITPLAPPTATRSKAPSVSSDSESEKVFTKL